MPNALLLLLRLLLSVGVVAVGAWIGWKLGGRPWLLIAVLFGSPIIGVAIARPLVELTHEGFGWLWAQPLAGWEGAYYAFDNVHVRVYEDGDELLFVAKDVLKALGIARPALELHARHLSRIPGTRLDAFSLPALERFLSGRNSHQTGRFLLWARREVAGPWEKKRAAAR